MVMPNVSGENRAPLNPLQKVPQAPPFSIPKGQNPGAFAQNVVQTPSMPMQGAGGGMPIQMGGGGMPGLPLPGMNPLAIQPEEQNLFGDDLIMDKQTAEDNIRETLTGAFMELLLGEL